jgi:hypothetical protein
LAGPVRVCEIREKLDCPAYAESAEESSESV